MRRRHPEYESPQAAGLKPVLCVALSLIAVLAAATQIGPRAFEPWPALIAAACLALAGGLAWAARGVSPWAVAALGVVALLLAYFHDRFWWAPDEGVAAYVAQRILAGDVLNGNLQELHPGYFTFLHAAAFLLFGTDMVSLRYPLVAVTLLQSAIGYWLLAPRGPLYAAAGAVALAAVSLLQYLNPSPNWYALFAAFTVVALLCRDEAGDPRREILIGALLAATFLLRQLSGVVLAMGAVTWLLSEPRPEPAARPRLARVILAVMAFGLAGYLWRNASIDAVALVGLWPLALIGMAAARTRIGDAASLRLIGRLALGGILAALPLFAYHLYHGTFASFYVDTVQATLHLSGLDFVHQRRYWFIVVLALRELAALQGPAAVASSLFWLALLAVAPALGIWLAAGARRPASGLWHPLPVVAVFYALVCTPFEIPIYLTFAVGLPLVALLWVAGRGRGGRIGFGAAAVLIAVIGIVFHAGQPLTRTLGGIVEGRRVALDATEMLPRASLRIERREQEIYAKVLALIDRTVPPGAPFLAFPVNPELYFMSARPAPFRFHSTAIGILDEAALRAVIETLERAPPPLVIHDPADKYNNWASAALLEHVRTRYALAETIGPFDIYLPK